MLIIEQTLRHQTGNLLLKQKSEKLRTVNPAIVLATGEIGVLVIDIILPPFKPLRETKYL